LPGDIDPAEQLAELRARVNSILHGDGTLPLVAGLYDDSLTWFVRLFTPPDERLRALVELARDPFTDAEQVARLRTRIAYNAHHLLRFLSEIRDSAWLNALFDQGLIHLPRDGEPWPVTALVGGNNDIPPAAVVGLLRRLRNTTTGQSQQAVSLDRNVVQLCLRLGPDSFDLLADILRQRPHDPWILHIAVLVAKDAEPSDPLQLTVADAVIGNEARSGDTSYETRTIARLLVDGIDSHNARQRVELLAVKIARIGSTPAARLSPHDIAALNTPDPNDDLRDDLAILTERLVAAIPVWRDLELPTSELVELMASIPGEVGERVICRVLAGALDVDRVVKLSHLCLRVASETATGDDRDLMVDLGSLSATEVKQLQAAFGVPPAPPESDEAEPHSIPADWERAWRWSAVLPAAVLSAWDDAIAAVAEVHGAPTGDSFSRRIPRFLSIRAESPYRAEQLAALPPIEAASLVASWRQPTESTPWPGSGHHELAGELETAIEAQVVTWAAQPVEVIRALREPAYIQRYLKVLQGHAKELVDAIGPIMNAVAMIRAEPWTPADLPRVPIAPEAAWAPLNRPIVELIGAFANANADFGSHLGLAWDVTDKCVRALPDELPPLAETYDLDAHDDAYGRAINRTYGQALETAIALGWQARHREQAPLAQLGDLLDWVLEVPGSVGAELRSVIAVHRPVLEYAAEDWLSRRHALLFGGPLGLVTFEATVKYARPTTWLFEHCRSQLVDATLRGVPNAVSLRLIGYLWDIDRYTIVSILGSARGQVPVLRQIAEELPSLIQHVESDDPLLARAVAFWDGMLDGPASNIPAAPLAATGRWVYVKAVSTDDLVDRFERTTALTSGEVDYATEVAERCRDAQPNETALRVLLRMQGHGQPWERDHVGRVAVEALARASGKGLSDEFNRLRLRLIDLGFHSAADISPEPPARRSEG
jgi:hypothetical protein